MQRLRVLPAPPGWGCPRRFLPAAVALVAIVTLAGCSSPAPEDDGAIHLIPLLARDLEEHPPPPAPEPVDLLALTGWTAENGVLATGAAGLSVRAEGDAAWTALRSPAGLALPVARMETLALRLGVTGASRFEVWAEEPGKHAGVERALSRETHLEMAIDPGEVRALSIPGERFLAPEVELVDRVVLVVRWTGDDARTITLDGADALATGERPGAGGVRHERVRRPDANLDAWRMGAGETHRAHVRLPDGARLLTSIGVPHNRDDASFEIAIDTGKGESVVFRNAGPLGEAWLPVDVDLAEYGGREVDVVLRTTGNRRAVFAWGAPVIVAPSPSRPPVVVWVIDTLRDDALGAYGFPGRASPWIDRWARSGVLFPDFVSTTSWTRPAMGSLMTSRGALVHGAVVESREIRGDLPTFAEQMSDAGWYTVALISNPNAGRAAGLDRGYDRVIDLGGLQRALQRATPGSVPVSVSSSGTSEAIHAWLREWLPGMADVPLFLYVHANDPHRPSEPRAPFSAIPDVGRPSITRPKLAAWARVYGADVFAADHFFGRTMQLLQRAFAGREWVQIVTADHGEEFREHGRMGHGTDLWREQTRIPLVLRAPGRLPSGSMAPRRASLLDVQPTVLDLLSLPPVDSHEGRSLLAEIAAASRGGEESGDAAAADAGSPATNFLHLIHQERRLTQASLADSAVVGEIAFLEGPWKLMVEDYADSTKPELHLYDLQEDPGEARDVARDDPDLAEEMLARALGKWSEDRSARGDGSVAAEMDAETVEVLRALGYLQ